MRQRTFVWSLGTVRGSEPGWLPVNAAEGWFPGPGFLTAHDTMEHLSDKPDWAHELRAAGVSAYLVDGVAHRSLESIADDVVGFAARDHKFAVPPAPKLAYKGLPPADEARVQELMRVIGNQVERGMRRAKEAGVQAPADAIERAPYFVQKAEPWIRLGYRAAMRVYGAGQGRETGLFMDRIRDAINRDHDAKPPLKGDKLTVAINAQEKTFSLHREDVKKLSLRDRKHEALIEGFQAALFGVIA